MRRVRAAQLVVLSSIGVLEVGVAQDASNLFEMSIEDLSSVRVTSVSRTEQSLATAAASIYVIDAEQIRRSGATTLSEALRLAPNLQVAQIENELYAISTRGFNTNIANKLLVLIDGRTVYSPLFSGVFWDTRDVMLEDVERIEIIDGPGAATWGTNAVNGVVNVITRTAADTPGVLVGAATGSHDSTAEVRYGGAMPNDGHFRVYTKVAALDNTVRTTGAPVLDEWERTRAGFRADWGSSDDGVTLQGDLVSGSSQDRPVVGKIDVSGMNVLGQWRRRRDDGSAMVLQAYVDHTDRVDRVLLQEEERIVDVEFRHTLALGGQDLMWGAGYRHAKSSSETGINFAFIPRDQDLNWYHAFVQDEIPLSQKVSLGLGLRLEHNDYTGWEVLPSARLGWQIDETRLLWTALSHAVRSPARLDREIFAPISAPFVVGGGPNFVSEEADVLEVGYRAQPSATLSLSVTAYYDRYDKLRSGELAPPGRNTLLFIGNGIEGEVTGLEAWGNWQAAPGWRLSWGALRMDKDLRRKPGSTDPVGPSNLGNDPEFQIMLRSMLDIGARYDLDVMVRRVGELPQPRIAPYTAVDARFGWEISDSLALSFIVRNLFDDGHVEFNSAPAPAEVDRQGLVRVVWRP